MLSAILQSLTRPSELQALVSYKFAPKSENIRIHQDNLAKDESKRRCYDFLNKVQQIIVLSSNEYLHPLFLVVVRLLVVSQPSFKNWTISFATL